MYIVKGVRDRTRRRATDGLGRYLRQKPKAQKPKSPKAFVEGKRLPICPVFIGHCSFVVFYQMPHKRPTKKNGLEFFSKPLILWWVWKDLNLRPRDYESPALTS